MALIAAQLNASVTVVATVYVALGIVFLFPRLLGSLSLPVPHHRRKLGVKTILTNQPHWLFNSRTATIAVHRGHRKVRHCAIQRTSAKIKTNDALLRERERGIRMIYSFRPLPLMKGCRWMTYHLTVHTVTIPINKKTIKLTTMYLTRY